MNPVRFIQTEEESDVSNLFMDKGIEILGISNYGLGGYTVWIKDANVATGEEVKE